MCSLLLKELTWIISHLWCDQAKSVWSWSNSVFTFLTNCLHHFHSYILQKTPLKLVNWFQRYEQLKDAKNNRKQKTFFALFGSILKSIYPTSGWFCLITSHFLLQKELTWVIFFFWRNRLESFSSPEGTDLSHFHFLKELTWSFSSPEGTDLSHFLLKELAVTWLTQTWHRIYKWVKISAYGDLNFFAVFDQSTFWGSSR